MDSRHGPIAIEAPNRAIRTFGTPPEGLLADVAAKGACCENCPVDDVADLIKVPHVARDCTRRAGLDSDQPRNVTHSVIQKA